MINRTEGGSRRLRPALLQYLTAVIACLSMLGYQAWELMTRWGLDVMHPRIQVMREQMIESLFQNPRALAVVTLHLGAMAVAHVVIGIAAVFVYRYATPAFRPEWRDRFLPSACFLVTALLTAALWNRLLYPYSTALRDVELLLIQEASPLLMWVSSAAVFSGLLAASWRGAQRSPRKATGLAVVVCTVFLWGHAKPVPPRDLSRSSSPDIIILGIDSLRPDMLRHYGFAGREFMPTVEHLLEDGVTFKDAVTPLARTFVSYMSLLTGDNPVTHGARFNLYPREFFKRDDSLATLLRARGFYNIMAIDESRFANFDESFGFHEIISPPPGALDFILGNTFDTVGTNLLMTLPLTQQMFEYARPNRAAYNVYHPSSHVDSIIESINHAPADQPLFLVSHFCLPHWPYLPANILVEDSNQLSVDHSELEGVPASYLRAMVAVDSQVDTVVNALRRAGRLENAILVVLSDHGEGFATPRDTKENLAPFASIDRPTTPFGHGSMALSRAQHQVVLGMQKYIDGKPVWTPHAISGPASIIDVAPTLADDIGTGIASFDGRSMLSTIRSQSGVLPDQVRFVENGIRSTGVEQHVVDEKAVAREMAYLYRIDEDLRFEIRPSLLSRKISEKQRGVIWGRFGLAASPDVVNGSGGCWVLVNYEDHSTECVDYPADDPVVKQMQEATCSHFRQDPGFRERWCNNSVRE